MGLVGFLDTTRGTAIAVNAEDLSDCIYVGPHGNQVWQEASGCNSPVPMDRNSLCTHWDQCLGELLSPFKANDLPSKLSVAALMDYGYTVNETSPFISDLDTSQCSCDQGRRREDEVAPSSGTRYQDFGRHLSENTLAEVMSFASKTFHDLKHQKQNLRPNLLPYFKGDSGIVISYTEETEESNGRVSSMLVTPDMVDKYFSTQG